MSQIIPSDFDIIAEDSTEFVPMRGVANCHLQTMLPRLIRRKVQFTPHWQRLDLPDGDFLDLAWSEEPEQARHKPRLVVFTVWKAVCTAPMHTGSSRQPKRGAGSAW